MSFPVADWQFWAVTASMLGSVWMLVRPFVGERKPKTSRGGCADCAIGAAAAQSCVTGNHGGRGTLVVIGGQAARRRPEDGSAGGG